MGGLSIDTPVTLTSALSSGRVVPGDTLLLADGTYAGDFTSIISGTEALPIIIKPQNPGNVTIDGSLLVTGPHTHWFDIDFTDTAEDRTVTTSGVRIDPVGTWMVGCSFSNLRSSGINWFGSGAGAVLECKFDACLGHSLYTHNNSGGLRQIERCLFNTRALTRYGLHVFSEGDNYLRDYQIRNNVHKTNVIVGGGSGLVDLDYSSNIHHGSWLYLGLYKNSGAVDTGSTADDNIAIDLESLQVDESEGLVCTDNVFYRGLVNYELPSGWTETEKPETLSYTIPFTLSERWTGIQVDYVTATGAFTAVLTT